MTNSPANVSRDGVHRRASRDCSRGRRPRSGLNEAGYIVSFAARPAVASCRERRGSVIMVVLVTILFATMALAVFIERASTDLLVESRDATAGRMRQEATAALETTLAVLEDFRLVNGSWRSPAEGWADPLGFAGYVPSEGRTVEVAFEDESGKFSLPEMTASTLTNIFKGWGLQQNEAEKLADALLGWMKAEHVPASASAPRAEDYERGEIPFAPPDRPLRSYGELAAIDVARDVFYDEAGRPNELWQRFRQTFSLYRFKSPNVNGANPDYFAGLGGTDTGQQARISDYLNGTGPYAAQGAGYFKSAQEVANLLGGQAPADNIGTEISALRVIVTVREGRNSYRLSALVAPPGGAEIPPPKAEKKKQRDPEDGGSDRPAEPTAGAPAKKLNYPFAVLEFRENDEKPVDSPPTTKSEK